MCLAFSATGDFLVRVNSLGWGKDYGPLLFLFSASTEHGTPPLGRPRDRQIVSFPSWPPFCVQREHDKVTENVKNVKTVVDAFDAHPFDGEKRHLFSIHTMTEKDTFFA